jgi:single-strand DNA-binding protein
MAGSLNQVTLIGFVGKDPEIRYTAAGQAIANLSVATTEKWKDKATGDLKEKTEWHRCVCFDRQAELIEGYVKSGSYLHLTGKLATRKWQDKDGQDRYTTEITVAKILFLDRKSSDDQPAPSSPRQARAPASRDPRGNSYADARAGSAPAKSPPGGLADFDDDIPF